MYIFIISGCSNPSQQDTRGEFDPDRAYQDVAYQVSLGPRTLGSEAHQKVQDYIIETVTKYNWEFDQQTIREPFAIHNLIAKRNNGNKWILVGAHYDSRFFADMDPVQDLQSEAVSGANDGASGTAVLLELARSLPVLLEKEIWLVFFDAEDNGRIEGYDWIMGSQRFVSSLDTYPDQVVIVDMVGDSDLTLYYEKNSDHGIRQEIWETAKVLEYNQFIPEERHRILDDHIPFVELGVPAIDIIDFDYPYWHTTQDTIDKISAESLQAVGDTILTWLMK